MPNLICTIMDIFDQEFDSGQPSLMLIGRHSHMVCGVIPDFNLANSNFLIEILI
jgi:hypothetical protein